MEANLVGVVAECNSKREKEKNDVPGPRPTQS